MNLEENIIEIVVSRCAEIKAGIVQQDERENGLRYVLNFGHTLGHGVESASDFNIKHGFAVSLGMAAAARISHKMGYLSDDHLNRLENLLKRFGLPVKLIGLDTNTILKAMSHDKKVNLGKIRFVLPNQLGKVFLCDEVDVK